MLELFEEETLLAATGRCVDLKARGGGSARSPNLFVIVAVSSKLLQGR